MADAHTIPTLTDRGRPLSGIIDDDPGIKAGTERRDVSEVLDLLALDETPFINKVGWGSESGGVTIEWISEDLGPGWFYQISDINGSGGYSSIYAVSADGLAAGEAFKQLVNGQVLYHFSSSDSEHALYQVLSSEVTGTMILSELVAPGTGTSIIAGEKFYIMGAVVNEGSKPVSGKPRTRTVCSNAFNILRKDVQITGSAKATDIIASGREDTHQIRMRLSEMQRERERMSLYSYANTRTSAEAGTMNGCFGWLMQTIPQARASTDSTTRTLTETAFNTVVNDVWKHGGRNLTFFAPLEQTANFTQWDKNRIRTSINEGKGGGHITSYLTESGIVVDLVPMGMVPHNLAFLIDTSKVQLRAKNGRKAILEKLGKAADADDWQILSEFSLEMKGWNLGKHGMFSVLA